MSQQVDQDGGGGKDRSGIKATKHPWLLTSQTLPAKVSPEQQTPTSSFLLSTEGSSRSILWESEKPSSLGRDKLSPRISQIFVYFGSVFPCQYKFFDLQVLPLSCNLQCLAGLSHAQMSRTCIAPAPPAGWLYEHHLSTFVWANVYYSNLLIVFSSTLRLILFLGPYFNKTFLYIH